MDEDGDLFVVDRVKDMIITGAENVYPSEVEDNLMAHPAVVDACAFGLPDERWGERIVAAVVIATEYTLSADELISFCRSRLAAYKWPRSVLIWRQLPKSAIGKTLRREARQMAIAELDSRTDANRREM